MPSASVQQADTLMTSTPNEQTARRRAGRPVKDPETDDTPATLCPDPDEEPTPRERLAAVLERRLDIPMAILAVVWAFLVAYELAAPSHQRPVLAIAGNVIWGVFVLEFTTKLAVSGRPLRFLRRRWPSAVFLVVPALRLLRIVPALRVVRLLPAARVASASYRAVGTARGLLQGRLTFLLAGTGIVIFGGGQLLYVLERGVDGGVGSLGSALWWSANVAISGTLVFDPVTVAGRLLGLVLAAYSLVVVAAVAGALGAYFMEARAERVAHEDETG